MCNVSHNHGSINYNTYYQLGIINKINYIYVIISTKLKDHFSLACFESLIFDAS